MEVIELKAQEYGMRVFEVIEYNIIRPSTVLITAFKSRGGRGE
ncbi:MAG: hypothetical protein RXR03_03420 [Thermocladium sp.]